MRTDHLLSIRPELNLLATPDQSVKEAFQNTTLRPILKLQHTLTLSILMDDKNFSKQLRKFQTKEELHTGITAFINKNKDFRSMILGCIIGMMTKEEYDTYRNDYSEYNKRIMTMQIQRYVDSIKV